LYNLRILAEGSLVVILAIKFNLELRATFNEGCSLVLAYRIAVALSQQRISYILYYSKPGLKSSRVKVKGMLNNHILLCLKELFGVRRAILLKRYSSELSTECTLRDVVDSCSASLG
jgi:hypothetical protein